MTRQPARTPCLGERVTGLADGTLRPDVRDRALAHTLTCPDCRQALEAERSTLAALRSAPAPAPSARLVTELIALGGTAGPLPPRRGFGPGMPVPAPVSIAAGHRARARRRTALLATAGAAAASVAAVGLLTVTAGGTAAPATARLAIRPPASTPLPSSVPASVPLSVPTSVSTVPPVVGVPTAASTARGSRSVVGSALPAFLPWGPVVVASRTPAPSRTPVVWPQVHPALAATDGR